MAAACGGLFVPPISATRFASSGSPRARSALLRVGCRSPRWCARRSCWRSRSHRIGATAAIVLLAVFSAAVARAIARGQQLECDCFGALHSAPITVVTLARDVALIAVAVLLLAAGPGHAPSVSLGGAES